MSFPQIALADLAEPCCALGEAPLGAEDAERLAARLAVLADPMRLRVRSHVAAQGCEAVRACELEEPLGLSQPTVSHHLKKLVGAGLLTRRREGRSVHYGVVPAAFAEIRRVLDLG